MLATFGMSCAQDCSHNDQIGRQIVADRDRGVSERAEDLAGTQGVINQQRAGLPIEQARRTIIFIDRIVEYIYRTNMSADEAARYSTERCLAVNSGTESVDNWSPGQAQGFSSQAPQPSYNYQAARPSYGNAARQPRQGNSYASTSGPPMCPHLYCDETGGAHHINCCNQPVTYTNTFGHTCGDPMSEYNTPADRWRGWYFNNRGSMSNWPGC